MYIILYPYNKKKEVRDLKYRNGTSKIRSLLHSVLLLAFMQAAAGKVELHLTP